MTDESSTRLHVLAVAGSLHDRSSTRQVLQVMGEDLVRRGCSVDFLDFVTEPIPLFDVDTTYRAPYYAPLRERVLRADAFLLGTPDYHGSMSSGLKNFLDHFWKEFAGKLFAPVVASYEKGLTVTDQVHTVARQCYAWSMPYAVSFNEREDLKDGQISSESFRGRAEMYCRDLTVYGRLLASQRRSDLAGSEPGFLARYR